ncbi:MAG: tetratricopeptide repeat protein [Kofleriaceae bacterium]|nr:tetratricopeptide repeat protein [Kofleriaceae bacterium]
MDSRRVEVLIEQASVQTGLANHKGALELLQQALSLDPDHARAHAFLAIVLVGLNRLPAAEIEVRMALHLDGNDHFSHYAAAFVYSAMRKLDEAWRHCLVSIDGDPDNAEPKVLGARICMLREERAQARELLDEALALEPSDADALTQLARLEYNERNYAIAAARIEEALQSNPSDLDAHVVAGLIDLARGDVDSAETHARFVLNQNANERDGLTLWAAVKARRSWYLGIWWRWNTWINNRSETSQVALMIGSFVIARIAMILAGAFGFETLERVLVYTWLAFCAYTWFAPAIFRWMLEKDLGTVTLDPDY